MRTLFAKVIFGFLLCTLAACSPIMQSQFEMVPPATMEGRNCANNCLMFKGQCEQNCQQQEQQCARDADNQANIDYLSYVASRAASQQTIDKDRRDFRRYTNCSASQCRDNCGDNYRLCHMNCGGQVLEHRVCTAFCDK